MVCVSFVGISFASLDVAVSLRWTTRFRTTGSELAALDRPRHREEDWSPKRVLSLVTRKSRLPMKDRTMGGTQYLDLSLPGTRVGQERLHLTSPSTSPLAPSSLIPPLPEPLSSTSAAAGHHHPTADRVRKALVLIEGLVWARALPPRAPAARH